MKERVFLSNNQDGIIENYWMMHFFNVTDVLTNRVNCSGSTFNLTLFWRVVRDLGALYPLHTPTICMRFDRVRSIVSDWLVCAGSIAYDWIACWVITSNQDSLDTIVWSYDRNNKSHHLIALPLVCADKLETIKYPRHYVPPSRQVLAWWHC